MSSREERRFRATHKVMPIKTAHSNGSFVEADVRVKKPSRARRQRYVVWATYDDGFKVEVCDRGTTFTRDDADQVVVDPTTQKLYNDAKLTVEPAETV
jgi:hypothetical protein